jgi:hypothetical protein
MGIPAIGFPAGGKPRHIHSTNEEIDVTEREATISALAQLVDARSRALARK